ncbi:MAG TPA: pyridoxamine 5'-phosphate oxidase family protein [Clostridia bacterium]|nr:pyridoxamine 5'-phosphate oxidase family protein [Clostridia bacterium]
MRRTDKEITDKKQIEVILQKAITCRIAMCEDNIPYVVPVNYGYKDDCLFFHSAKEGKKIDIIKKNNNVCFEIDIENELVKAEIICNWGCRYYSVIGSGKAYLLESLEEKRIGLDIISSHYTGQFRHQMPNDAIGRIEVLKIEIESMSGKKSGY